MRDDAKHPWREAFRSLWFLPSVFVVLALAAGYLLSQVELTGGIWDSLIFQGSAGAARELLVVVAGTMITVTGLVFVLTVVALQIASTQFSLRLLRTFLQDTGTRLVLGVFVATFAYSLGGLFTVGQTADDGSPFVPRLAVTGSLLLALGSVGMLVYYIQHITNSIRIDTVMVGVRTVTQRSIRRHFPGRVTDVDDSPGPRPTPPADAAIITSDRSGYIQEHDIEALLAVTRRFDVGIQLRHQVGQHVVAGAPLGWVWADRTLSAVDVETIHVPVNRAVARGDERRVEDDVGFGLRQLVDIAVRAVAPSLNDPYTAVQAVQHLSVLLTELATVDISDHCHGDRDRLRLFVPVPTFGVFLDIVVGNLRRNARNRPRVLVELFRMLENAAVTGAPASRRTEIADRVRQIMSDVEDMRYLDGNSEHDVEWIRFHADRAIRATETGTVAPR